MGQGFLTLVLSHMDLFELVGDCIHGPIHGKRGVRHYGVVHTCKCTGIPLPQERSRGAGMSTTRSKHHTFARTGGLGSGS